jgi:hypothetical protein
MLASTSSSPAAPSPRHFCAKIPATHFSFGAGGSSSHFASAASCAEQQDDFFGFEQHADFAFRAARPATVGRTCSGGSIPRASAHVSFSSSVKQQQSPAQLSSDAVQPHA